jgi:hypothetical protein
MNEFREAVSGFRNAMREEGERSVCPGLQTILHRQQVAKSFRLRWAAAAAVILLTLGAVPVYQDAVYKNAQKEREAAQEQADILLLEQINAGLSRSEPPAMAPLMGLP